MTHYQVILERVPNQSSDFATNPKSYLDTYSDESISLNYNIADVYDLANKNSSYSKTLKFPNTRNNQQVFSEIFEINVTRQYDFNVASTAYFNPNRKVKAWILKDNVIQFEGNLQLTNIVYDYMQDTIVYECVVYSENDGLFKSIGELYLSDLNLSRFDHQWNSTNIMYSWEAPYGNGYYYPMIDYGTPLSLTRTFRVSDFMPGFYAKTLFDQIFAEAGYSYVSDFLSGEYFSHLVIPYSSKSIPGSITLGFNNNKEILKVSQNIPSVYTYTASTPLTTTGIYYVQGQYFYHGGYMIGDTSDYNPNNLYNFTYSWYENPNDQRFAQRISINIGLLKSRLTYQNGDDQWGSGDIYIYAFRSVGSQNFGPTGSVFNIFGISAPQPPYNRAWKALTFGGKRYYSLKNNPQGVQVGYNPTTQEFQFSGTILTDMVIDPNSLQEGEKIMIWFGRDSVLTYKNSDGLIPPTPPGTPLLGLVSSKLTVDKMTLSVIYDDTQAVENSLILSSKVLPNIKQKDFIVNVMRMFNLYIDIDKTAQKRFLIEPRDEYYSKYQRTKDWSDKIDLSEKVDSQIASNLQTRSQILTYKDDKDYYNTEYKNITNTVFGEYKYEFDNEFAAGEKKIELIFSPTPVNKLPLSNQIYIPSIYGFNNGNISNLGGFNTRILYAKTIGLSASDSWKFWTNGFNTGTAATMSVYPYVSYADDPISPSQSLNFGTIQSFYPEYNETINNLYYTYWQNTFLELNSSESRIIEASFNLTPYDINDFSFADLIYCSIDNMAGYYRVNRIMDYDPSKYQSTKVELIKALNYTNNIPSFVSSCGVVVEKCLVGSYLTDFLDTINSYYASPTHYLTFYSNAPSDPTTFTYNIISSTTSVSNIVDWANITIPGMEATYYPGVTGCTLNFEVQMGEEATNTFLGTLNNLYDNSPADGGTGPDPYVVIYINYPCGATYGTWDENNNTYFLTLTGFNDQYTFLDWWLTNIPGSYGTASGEVLAENAYLKLGWNWETSCTQSATCSGEGLQLYIAESSVDYLPGGWTPDLFVSNPVLGPTSGPVFDAGGLTYGISQNICECTEDTLCLTYTSTLPCPGGEAFLDAYISTAIPTEITETLFESAPDFCQCENPSLSKSSYLPQSTGFRTPPPLSNTTYLGVLNTSRDNLVQAPNNIVLGENTNVYSANNIVVGENNGNIVGGFNFVLGASNSTTDTSNNPSLLVGTNIINEAEGTFIFGNNVSLLRPFGASGSTASIPAVENVFVVGSNLTLGGSQSILPNTTYLGTENIILSQNGGFNTPFIISEASSTSELPTGQTKIATYTGKSLSAYGSTLVISIFGDGPGQIYWNDIRTFSPISIEACIRLESIANDGWAVSWHKSSYWWNGVYVIDVAFIADHKTTDLDGVAIGVIAIDMGSFGPPGGPYNASINVDNTSAGEVFNVYYDLTIKYQYQ